MKPQILTEKQIGDLLDLEKEYVYYCSDGSRKHTLNCWPVVQAQLDADIAYYEPLLEQAQADGYDAGIKAIEPELGQARAEVAREAKDLFPEHIRPRHLECWAEQLTRDWGYSSELTMFLKSVAIKWQSFESKYGGQKK